MGRFSGATRKIILLVLVGCTILTIAGCLPQLDFSPLIDKAMREEQRQKGLSIEGLDETTLTMQSGMKLLDSAMPLHLSDDNQVLYSTFTDEEVFQTYYDWYSTPHVVKKDFRAFCDFLSQEYSRQKGIDLSNIYLMIDIKMVYDYKSDVLYFPEMYEKELLALEKFQVQSVQALTFNESARDYLIENGFSDGINEWIDAPETGAFFVTCPYVGIYDGKMVTDFSTSVKY